MNNSWGFNLTDRRHKSTRELMHYLVRAAGHGANFLLNVGPCRTGRSSRSSRAPPADGPVDGRHGESIYGTRGGPVTPRPWGVTTQKGDAVYVHLLDWTMRPLPPRPAPPREVGPAAEGRTPRRRAADGLRPRPFAARGGARSVRHRDRRRPGPRSEGPVPHDVATIGGRLASILVLAAALGTAGLAETSDLADIRTRGALRVIIAADESPDTFALSGGARPGFERDLMERFAQLHDVRLEVVRAPGYAERILCSCVARATSSPPSSTPPTAVRRWPSRAR